MEGSRSPLTPESNKSLDAKEENKLSKAPLPLHLLEIEEEITQKEFYQKVEACFKFNAKLTNIQTLAHYIYTSRLPDIVC